jgi:hypothetical protein
VNVLVIPEDFRLDQYILKPIIKAMMAEIGRPLANVRVLQEKLGSVQEALKWSNVSAVIDRYRGMVNLFVLIVDRDGDPHRRSRLTEIEHQAAPMCTLLAENAWQELEVWALAGQKLPWTWKDVRAEQHPKEKYFEPFAKSRGLQNEPGRGRTTLGREAAARYGRVRQLCAEDVGALEKRIVGLG